MVLVSEGSGVGGCWCFLLGACLDAEASNSCVAHATKDEGEQQEGIALLLPGSLDCKAY